MQGKMDSVQFESSREIEKIISALVEWKEKHSQDVKYDTVQELIDKLEVIHMNW